MQESGSCVQKNCAILGVHPTSWVHFGSNRRRTARKTGLNEVCRAKTNQRDSKSEFNFEPEGREFESLRARQFYILLSAAGLLAVSPDIWIDLVSDPIVLHKNCKERSHQQ